MFSFSCAVGWLVPFLDLLKIFGRIGSEFGVRRFCVSLGSWGTGHPLACVANGDNSTDRP